MRKYINVSFFYFILAMIAGVFYREFTKINAFSGRTVLGFTHSHLLALGTLVFLIVALFYDKFNLANNKKFKMFFKLYNSGLILTVIMMLVRGVIQVKEVALTASKSAMISGIAGLGHIILFVGLLLFFMALREESAKEIQ
nr:DUF2871 family protein [uncultured Peptostreptococcus sp.]